MSIPPFIDTVHAAEMLHISPDAVLDLIAEGTLRPFGGKPSNPFLRTADVQALLAQRGAQAAETETPKRVKSASARVQTRLTADARWAEVSEADIREWAQRADRARRQAARTTAALAIQRLQAVLQALDEADSATPLPPLDSP